MIPRAVWIDRSDVYHRAAYRETAAGVVAPCGVLVFSNMRRAKEATAHRAETLGLRACRRCFPTTGPL